MKEDSGLFPLRQPDSVDDPLTETAREGARRMLAPSHSTRQFRKTRRLIRPRSFKR